MTIALYSGGMFILIKTTMDIKYMPMIWEKNNTKTFELLLDEIQMKNFDIVSNKPLKLKKICNMHILMYDLS